MATERENLNTKEISELELLHTPVKDNGKPVLETSRYYTEEKRLKSLI